MVTKHKCRSSQFFGGARIFCPKFLKFARKTFTRQCFFLQIFCSCWWYIIFSSTNRHWNRKCYTWKFGYWIIQLKQIRLVYARTLSEASWISILEHLPHNSEVFHSHSSYCCQQWTPDLAEIGLKLFPSLKTCMWYVCHASYYLYYLCYDHAVTLTTLSVQLHIYVTRNKFRGKMFSSKYCR